MLIELAVENYAVVDKLRVPFYPGLNLLTGETGSGKSILVGALELLFGGRASVEVIRSGEPKARVSGRFDVGGNRSLEELLQAAGLESEDGELLLEREILSTGKSRIYVGGRASTAAILKEIASHLGDIHGQHDQQQLYRPEAQRDMLDDFAQAGTLRDKVRDAYRKWRAVEAELAGLQGNEQEKLRQLDIWQFQQKEIQAAALKAGEDTALDEEKHVQQNVGKLLENAGSAYTAIYEDPGSAYAQLRTAMRKLEEVARIDSVLGEVRASLEPAVIAIQEASYALRDYVGKLEADPARLEEIESRLALVERLKRKYGGTLEAILGFVQDLDRKIANIENAGERVEELKAQQQTLAKAYETRAKELSDTRKEAGKRLSRAVEKELEALAMERTVFRISIEPADWSDHGADAVRFLVSPNRGEEPKPMEKIASGGEVSRIALALKSCLVASHQASRGAPKTLVFDEVDTGIGGSAAEGVARRLKRLAASSQVLCVTHLAQVASFADHHFRVEKVEANGRTTTRVCELDRNERRNEVARMISGHRVTPEGLRHADQLIELARAGERSLF
jgi:DNA repair protein RecN (Recombination protein N)